MALLCSETSFSQQDYIYYQKHSPHQGRDLLSFSFDCRL